MMFFQIIRFIFALPVALLALPFLFIFFLVGSFCDPENWDYHLGINIDILYDILGVS
ncbi:MAG: hypothetical protein GY853_01355 [PVC group bacterium]|nr:hypothetical protein [PVC group bacterium]